MSQNDYHYYRDLLATPAQRTQGMEFDGLSLDYFDPALQDPRTARLSVEGHTVPLATPIDYMPWLNRDYALTQAGTDDPNFSVYYLNHFAQLFRDNPSDYTDALGPVIDRIADGKGALVADHSHQDLLTYDIDLPYISAQLGFRVSDRLSRRGQYVRHYHYASPIVSPNPVAEPSAQRMGLWEGYQNAVSQGLEDTTGPVRAHQTLDEAALEQVWSYYNPAFAHLDQSDPVLSGFDKEQLGAIFQDPRFIKAAHHLQDGDIANMIIVAEARDCDWLNGAYYYQHYPEAMEAGRVITSPGVIARPDSRGLSKGTVGMMRKLIAYSGGEAVVTFACDEQSNQNVPSLAHLVFNYSGQLATNLHFPENYQIFRQYHFAGTA